MNTLDCDVVIVGAGVAGGFLACNLRRSGLRTLVCRLQQAGAGNKSRRPVGALHCQNAGRGRRVVEL